VLVNLLHTFSKIKSSPKTSKNKPTVILDVKRCGVLGQTVP